jgi:indolepyruvate ferredoxin oxidoreductase beta subunit
MQTCVLLCGVGGQGTILAAHILADVALKSGLSVKVSEIHGMSQRGGAVTTVVNFGETVNTMVSGQGEADLVVSFEMIEALRNIEQLKEGGQLIVADEVIKPAGVLTGKLEVPQNLEERLLGYGAKLVPCATFAKEAGNPKCANVVLLGAVAAALDFPKEIWLEVVANSVPAKALDANLKAFELGFSYGCKHA